MVGKLDLGAPASSVAEGANDAIYSYVMEAGELPRESAQAFASWLDEDWNTFDEDEDRTVGEVIAGALAFWRGHA